MGCRTVLRRGTCDPAILSSRSRRRAPVDETCSATRFQRLAHSERDGADSGVALISYALWQSHFAGDAAAVGTVLRLDAHSFTLIGVLPQGSAYPYNGQVWIPTVLDAADRAGNFAVFARMRPGVSLTQVRSAMPLVAAQIRQQYPDTVATYTLALSMRDNLLDRQDGPLRALTRIVGFATRGLHQRRDPVTGAINDSPPRVCHRAILGATTARRLRQLLAESLVIATFGCGAGLDRHRPRCASTASLRAVAVIALSGR